MASATTLTWLNAEVRRPSAKAPALAMQPATGCTSCWSAGVSVPGGCGIGRTRVSQVWGGASLRARSKNQNHSINYNNCTTNE